MKPVLCGAMFVLVVLIATNFAAAADDRAVALPAGVRPVWDLDKAARESTPTRERICINGLWRWQPAASGELTKPPEVPAGDWGYFKVPGCWPGITDYDQKDCQTVFAHPSWKSKSLGSVTSSWYQREIAIPAEWKDRRIALTLEYLNSFADVYVDGHPVRTAKFPAGEVDLPQWCRAGEKHVLSLHVVAMPLAAVLRSYRDTNNASAEQGKVARRGLCGDVYLVSTPQSRIDEIQVETSVRHKQIKVKAALNDLEADKNYILRAQVTDHGRVVKQFDSPQFAARDARKGRIAWSADWDPDKVWDPDKLWTSAKVKLWDIDTPENKYDLSVSLMQADSKLLDTALPVRFGFREFWIDGRDFYLNGTRIFLSAVPLDNATVGAAQANYAAAKESLLRLKSFGVNFVYAHNYDCEPGSHLSFAEILRAADDVGMLVALTQPHFSHYDWKSPDADKENGYARHAEFYARVAGNHPAVVAYSMSHNATGYDEDMNPAMIDGLTDPRDTWSKNNSKLALRAEAIVRGFDPSRIVYHHASGNLGVMHDSNFYPNWVPIQELSDWFEHWATKGVKPFFACEYGAPFSWDWAMYRGWWKGNRNWGSARAPWEFCLAEWNAQMFGDWAFQISRNEKANLRWEAKQYRTNGAWFRWDYPQSLSSKELTERYPVFAAYITDNWRAFRTWGVSGISPWEHELFWELRYGVDRGRKELAVDWDHLQRPGYSADYLDGQYERMDLAYERKDWIPTAAADALLRNNMPLLAYIAGKPDAFTSKDHIFYPGEIVEKQIIVINNSRRAVGCDCQWSLNLPTSIIGSEIETIVPTGDQHHLIVRCTLPKTLAPGKYALFAAVDFYSGESQVDGFSIDVLPRPPAVKSAARIALFDPRGETGKLLAGMGVSAKPVTATDDLSAFDVLIVGKSALTVDGPAPRVGRVRDGLRVLMFEQSADVLEKRFGFRVQEYGLRRVFPRVLDHPLLAGIGADQLCDWRGSATLLPPQLKYEFRPMYGPIVEWCGLQVPHLWRCGNRGNVASVLIEKPQRGNFLPIVDGGFSLQYSTLMEYREGRGMVLFCQLDVTGRTDVGVPPSGGSVGEPAADTLIANMLKYVSDWKPTPVRTAQYVGEATGREHLKAAGVAVADFKAGAALATDDVLIVGPGGGQELKSNRPTIADWLKAGGRMLAIGLDQTDLDALAPLDVHARHAEHIAAYFEPRGANSLLAGIGPADVHNRDPRQLPLITSGATIIGDGVLAQAKSANIVFCQLAPWQFDPKQYFLKKTFRRSSFLVSRLLGNMGVVSSTPLLARFESPIDPAKHEQRWLDGLYLDQPEEWDDPYRFFRW